MTVRKQLPSSFLRFGSSWKRRFIALMGNSLYVYKEDCTVDVSVAFCLFDDFTTFVCSLADVCKACASCGSDECHRCLCC